MRMAQMQAFYVMGLTGQGSNLSFPENLATVAEAVAAQRRLSLSLPRPAEVVPRRGAVSDAVVLVLASAGELRMCDVHEAVGVPLGEPVPRSTIKNCLAQGVGRRFERVERRRYRLVQ